MLYYFVEERMTLPALLRCLSEILQHKGDVGSSLNEENIAVRELPNVDDLTEVPGLKNV